MILKRLARNSLAYVAAVGCVAAAQLLHEILVYGLGTTFQTVTFYPAVLVAALFGGFFPGVVAAILSAVLLWNVVLPPTPFTFFPMQYPQFYYFVVFLIGNVGIAAVAGRYRQLRLRERAEKRHVEFLLRESTHRVKNCLAVTQGIARQIAKHVHNLDEFQDAFCERLQSLAYSHDLLVKHDWQSVNIRDLAVGQLEAFGDPGNVKTEGEPIFINPAATEQLGLALYELGSNSMKYGALKQDGKVSVTWRVLEDSTLEFVWRETGAPPHQVGQNGFGHLVLTEIVPKTLRGRGILTDNLDGITYRLSMHPQYYRTSSVAA